MKTITKLLAAAGLALTTLSAYADVELKDGSAIMGKWVVSHESLGIDKEKKALKVTWEFTPAGVLKTVADDIRTNEMKIDVKYSVENGAIKKQIAPGREKYEECKAVEMAGNSMVLRCGSLYLFMHR
jgi:hypothetical protein